MAGLTKGQLDGLLDRPLLAKVATVRKSRSATTPKRTSPEFATTFPAVAAALPAAYILGSTNPSAKPPKMPTSRYRPPAILAHVFLAGHLRLSLNIHCKLRL